MNKWLKGPFINYVRVLKVRMVQKSLHDLTGGGRGMNYSYERLFGFVPKIFPQFTLNYNTIILLIVMKFLKNFSEVFTIFYQNVPKTKYYETILKYTPVLLLSSPNFCYLFRQFFWNSWNNCQSYSLYFFQNVFKNISYVRRGRV